ncbi:MAG: hypothetical protein QME48_02970 [bacterium]|nr:hypothetical protein [bacterium]
MYVINIFSIFSFLLSLFFGFYLFFRKDVGFEKNNLLIFFLVFSYISLDIFIINSTFFGQGFKVTYSLTFLFFLFYNYFIFFYYFENYIKSIGVRIIYPFIAFIISSFVYTLSPVFFDATCPEKIFFVDKFLNEISHFSIFIFPFYILVLIFSIFQKRAFFFFISLVHTIFYISFFIESSNIFSLLFLLLTMLTTPIFIFLDFFSSRKYNIINTFDSELIIENLNFGVVTVDQKGKLNCNNFFRQLLLNEATTLEKWYDQNKGILKELEYDNFFNREFLIGNREFNLILEKRKIKSGFSSLDMYVIFNYTNVKILEKMSKEYTNFVFNSLLDRIYQFNIQNQYKKMYDFLKGFAHNSFSMISVIRAGFDYILDNIDELDKYVHTKKPAQLKSVFEEKINLLQKTLNFTDVGVSKLMESFKILNNKIRYEYEEGKTNFSLNDFVKQELFFYITNTEYKYTINIESKLNESLRDVVFEYRVLSTVFHNILSFTISEMATTHIKRIVVETYEKDGGVVLRIESSAKNFDKDKIDDIIKKSIYVSDQRYASFINAYLMIRSTGSILKRIDSEYLIFEILLNE